MAARNAEKIMSFQGLISAPFTGYTPDGEVNPDIIPPYIDHLVSQGVAGAFVNGTTGEGLSLSVKERKALAEQWVKYGKGKLDLIIIQVGANSMKDIQELASHAEKIGATGIAALPPLFYKPANLDQLVVYFKEISKAAPTLPLMLYHIPSYSSVEISVGEFLPKARQAIPNFIGAKFTSVDVRDLLKCHKTDPPTFKLLSGFDEVLLPCLSCGVTAAIGATYNFMGPLGLRILNAFKKGNYEEAHRLNIQCLDGVEKITRHGALCTTSSASTFTSLSRDGHAGKIFRSVIFDSLSTCTTSMCEGSATNCQGITCLKATMNILGPLDFGPPRAPLVPLDATALENLKKDIKSLPMDQWRKI